MSNLLKRSAVRDLALEEAARLRPTWGPSRVSQAYLDGLEARLKAYIRESIETHPSIGRTITRQGD